MKMEDYDTVYALWRNTPGISLGAADSREQIEAFLLRHPGFSFVAEVQGEIVGALLAAHDMRRGFLYHLAVKPEQRKKGIAQALVERCLMRLKDTGIAKVHVFVFRDNAEGMRFWQGSGWKQREDIHVFSHSIVSGE
jgi:ribosomal protein S18 acetylase RimI-like enzyme